MKFNKFYIENSLPFAIYLLLNAQDGELSVTARRNDPGGTDRLEPGLAAKYVVNALLRTCIRGGELRYAFHNRTGRQIVLSTESERSPDGLILRIADGRN